MQNKMSSIEGKVLGKNISHPETYTPSILVAVPRIENRKQYDLDNSGKLFTGWDSWHAWEFSFLTQKGLPVNGVLKIVYNAENEFLVESKSLKLYLNSFNMSKFGQTKEEGLHEVLKLIEKDLSELLKTEVKIAYFDKTQVPVQDFHDFKLLEDLVEIDEIDFTAFTEDPELIRTRNNKAEEFLSSDILRSNCKITNQPDWGSVFIYYKGKKQLDRHSLLEYLVSFRNENHFHEEVCEMIYKRLWDTLDPEKLMVSCVYTRRGGIDICPSRASQPDLLPKLLINEQILTDKLLRQ